MTTTFDADDLEALRRADELARARRACEAHDATARLPEDTGTILRTIGARLAATAPLEDDDPTRIQDAPTRAEWLLAKVVPPGRFVRLESAELAARVKLPTAFARSRDAVRKPLVVWRGASGRGKTSLACAALIAAIERGVSVKPAFASAWRLAVARSRHPLGEGEPPIVDRALGADLLVLDDLGSEQHGPTSAVPDVVFDREERGAPLWVTTWMTPEQMCKAYGDGIARRVFERAWVVEC